MTETARFCSRCLYPDWHPLGLTIGSDGVCSGCRVHEEKDSLDWVLRKKKLARLLESYRNRSHSNYDCVIPVSGGRDSFFIVHTVKREFGMNPLLVTYNRHYNTVLGLQNLSLLRTVFDCDLLNLTLKPQLVRAIARVTFERLGSFHWHALAGQTVFPVRIAVGLKIPLVIWGAHQGLEQVGMYSHLDEVEMTRRYRREHDLLGLEAEALADAAPELPERELTPLFYPDDKQLESVGVRGIYLGNYLRWDTKAQHERMLEIYGYQTAIVPRTFDPYNDADCVYYAGAHDYVKYLKHGFGRAFDDASREIRFGRLNRAQGQALADHYREIKPPRLTELCEWLSISLNEFFSVVGRHRNVNLPGEGRTDTACPPPGSRTQDLLAADCRYRVTSTVRFDNPGETQLLTKGFFDHTFRPSSATVEPCGPFFVQYDYSPPQATKDATAGREGFLSPENQGQVTE